ncbi:hypothetical protein [Candidatus Pristimantibacillus sp. PTI5]|uniref:hypothetical protein n=1 Tax=Candidatus Pristimantibacillus sp. PTI5 TaxID=3400422 RepID=UPI003B019D8D
MSVQSIHPEEEQRLTHTLQEIDRQLGGIGPRYLGVEQRLFKQTIIVNKEPSYKKIDWRRVNKKKRVMRATPMAKWFAVSSTLVARFA